jgi:hypothetical protein
MVFIQSQEFVDGFGRTSINVVSLEGQTDYKISLNQETGKYDVAIIMGDFSKYLFSEDNTVHCVKILQSILNHHATKDAFTITDVSAFITPEVSEEITLDEIEVLILNLLDLCGFKNVGDMWERKLNEECVDDNETEVSISINDVKNVSDDANITLSDIPNAVAATPSNNEKSTPSIPSNSMNGGDMLYV